MNAISLIVTLLISIALVGCGKEQQSTTAPAGCEPVAKADTGGDVYFSPDPAQSKVSKIGMPDADGVNCEWSPPTGLSNPNSCHPYVYAPSETILYTMTAKSKCNVSVSHMRAVALKELRGGVEKVKARDRFGVLREYPTGYNPGFLSHYRATYVHMPKDGWITARGVPDPDELNLTPPNFHVNQQPQGSCWAEGGRSSMEATYLYVTKIWEWVSTDRIIRCSGFGTASGGGQISVEDAVKFGLVRESDYRYTGHDGKCDKSIQPFFKADRAFELASFSGGNPDWQDFKHAMVAFGAPEVCGSAGALGSGGWNSNPGGGNTNHCYSGFQFLKGEKHGQPAGDYLVIQNSWGTGWGGGKDLAAGQGAYRLAPDGHKFRSAVVTEHKFLAMHSPCPPPIVDGGPDRTIKLTPGQPNSVQIGTPEVSGQSYIWMPSDTLDSAFVAQPIASPVKTTKYQVNAKNKCGDAHAEITVHVYREMNGVASEVR